MTLKIIPKYFQIFLKSYSTPVLSYFALLLVSSLSKYLALLVNFILLLYIGSINSKKKYNQLNVLLTALAFNNLTIYHVLVSAYAEVLPWEECLHFLFYAISFYFYYQYKIFKYSERGLIASKEQNWTSIDFNNNEMIKDYKKNEYYIKFLVYLFIASAYSSQLTFTTLCTPIMVYNWFLIPNECSLIFSTFYSALCSASGFFCVSTSLSALFQLIKVIKKISIQIKLVTN